ncbi:MAG TPA: DUF1802 family protein [Gemmatimonadaceae bacterium]|nr:DUF1802 family protein [Gemmatimonadaceae bacterium]
MARDSGLGMREAGSGKRNDLGGESVAQRAVALPASRIALPERIALKEWAVLVDAMARGEIIALIRKGGIREQRAGFAVRHPRFLLYPTFFHERESELAPRFLPQLEASHANRPPERMLRIGYVADAVAVWRVSELERLRAIEMEHGLAWPAVESRFMYRNLPGVHVVAVRVARLAHDVEIPEARRYGGCVSWVALDGEVDVSGATAVIPAESLDVRLERLHAALGEPLEPAE